MFVLPTRIYIKNLILWLLSLKAMGTLHLIQNKIIFFFIIVTCLKKIRVELCNLLKQYFPSIKFIIILVNHHTIGSLFKHKDRLNKDMRSAVALIYTGLHLSQPSQSHIRDHAISCNSNQISLDSFSIIGTNNNIWELRIFKSLLIFQIKP